MITFGPNDTIVLLHQDASRAGSRGRLSTLRLAIVIGRYVGGRRGDLAAIPLTARGDGRFEYMSGKRRRKIPG